MKKPPHILPVLTALLIGLLAMISCSSDSDIPGVGANSSSSIYGGNGFSSSSSQEYDWQSSSSALEDDDSSSSSSQENNSSSSSSSIEQSSSSVGSSSSSSETPPIAIDLPRSGHYESGLSLTVPAETEQGVVRCDTSGTDPNENSSIKSGTALNLTKTAILQCAYFKNGTAGKTFLRTYFVGRLPNLPIVSIAVNPVDMFTAPNKALYKSTNEPSTANSCGNMGRATFYTDEVLPVYVDFFEKGASLAWSYPAEIKLHGACSRQWDKKSMIVSFKEKYGQKNLKYPLFPEYPNLTKFKHFMLRNNGNNYPNDYIRDMLMSQLTEGLGIDYQKGRAVVVYYNGQYYGIHNLRERANSDYFETNYSIDEDYIDLVKIDKENVVSKGSDADYKHIVSWLEGNSLANDGNLRQLEQWVDVDNFTNHFQSRIFYKDCDWPGKNIKVWHSNSASPKWRYFLYDTDHGFGSYGTQHLQTNRQTMMQLVTATNGPAWPNPPYSTLLLRKLLENQSYKNAFINRFSLLIATYFTSAKISAKIDKLMGQINDEITYDQQKWGNKTSNMGLNTIRNFGNSRPAEMQTEIGNFFNLGNPVDFTLSVNGNGKILVHNLPLPSSSTTFKAYSGVPITVKAEGAGFKNWSDGNTSAERTISITGATTLTANF